MAKESKTLSKKDKKPKHKIPEKPAVPAPSMGIDTSLSPSTSKPPKKRKHKLSAEEPEAIVGAKSDEVPAKRRKKAKKTENEVEEPRAIAEGKEKKRKSSGPVEKETEEAPTVAAVIKGKKIEDTGKETPLAGAEKKKKRKNAGTASAEKELEPLPVPVKSDPLKHRETGKKSKSSKTKEQPPPPPPALLSGDEATDDAGPGPEPQGEDDDDGYLHGFSTDDDDSSDEEDAMNLENPAFDISKLPTIAKDDATVKRKLDKAKRQPTEDRGVLFLGRLPHGFYEDQLKGYFSQFGTITRIRLSRNKKTGRSKHYGFIEYDSSSVAQIVADTMDNYLLMGHILRCKVVPKDEVHPELWVGANRKWRAVPRDRIVRVEHNKPRTTAEQNRATKRLIKRQNDRKRKLAEAGIKYDFEAVSYKKTKDADT